MASINVKAHMIASSNNILLLTSDGFRRSVNLEGIVVARARENQPHQAPPLLGPRPSIHVLQNACSSFGTAATVSPPSYAEWRIGEYETLA
jgi:hypothetical protein